MNKKIDRRGNYMCIKYSKEKVASFLNELKEEFDIISKISNKDIDINNSSIDKEDFEKIYHYKYTKYIIYEFNNTIVNMIILYINKINSFPKKYKNEPNFTYNMISLFKYLLMNEIEVALFTILIDNIGWKYEYIDHWLYFNMLAILTKKLCGKENDFELLFNMLSRKNKHFIDDYSSFINDEKIIFTIKSSNVSLKSINKRYLQLTRPVNSYCRKNIINYQDIIDKIVKLSQPYSKEFSEDKKKDNNYKHNEIHKLNNININNNEKKQKKFISNKIQRNDEQNNYIIKPIDTDSEGYKFYGYGIQNNINKDDYNNINQAIFNLDSIDFLQFDDNI